ncbi:wings apart-like protein regulation of heterochromatin-domain-containing protein [Staphylotrichum tortipilum]|uniref:Wings apart-like protein regulation of heterochromatin-domain-containing protein n=1 Tax=Staphylotrichum tortipilum TaxID=2831512 RepID=A0AAN6MLW5_9PEZI|nr:wings apart-like protein regulation of heterochromatin-domain-containing protein [Staphylotrichum longicolle]
MAASNADSVYDFGSDFGFAPRKKVATTYGRGGRRRTETTKPATLRHSESAPAASSSAAKSQSKSPEPARPTRDVAAPKLKQQTIRKYGSAAPPKPAEEAQSQPLPDLYDFDTQVDEPVRTKKRRVKQEPSDRGRFTGPYSTPDSSPPGARSPARLSEEEASRPGLEASVPAASRRSTPERDVDMKDDAPTVMPFSAKTSRKLKNLSVSSKPVQPKKQKFPIRLSVQAPSNPSKPATNKPPRLPTSASAPTSGPVSQPVRKRRLIDTLAAQTQEEGSSSEDEASSQGSEGYGSQSQPTFRSSPPPPTPAAAQPKPVARPMTAKKTGPKFTYSQQRTMLADDDPLFGDGGLGGLGDGPAGGALFNFGRLTKSATISTFSYLDEDDETANTGAVRSIHELRQAGANSRFADEMDDILDRVGSPSAKPSSLRRGALLELANKMKHKDFRQQFRNHSDGGSLFKSLAEETDLISGYAILAVVTTLLATTTSAHLIQQLRSQGLATLISKLLDNTVDIAQLAKDRKQNVSKNAQLTLGLIKSSLLGLPVWEPFSLASLSPRTLALKCLDLLMRQPTHATAQDEVLSEAVTDRLFSILAGGVSNAACWDAASQQQESCDFYLALYVLEGHSISAMQSSLSSVWTRQYAPIVADVLETALKRPTEQMGDLESLTLRISLNITNHNGEASRLFVEMGLLQGLAKSACNAFGIIMNSMKVDSFLSKVLESLIMMMGAMINFCVYYPPASASLEERGDGAGSPLNRLIQVFAENHSKTADADSMEKTQLNVALGYLSVLLGYFCLSDSIRERFVAAQPKKNMQPLLDSIIEFITFHRKVAEAQGDEGAKQGSDSAALARLQDLADQLAVLR